MNARLEKNLATLLTGACLFWAVCLRRRREHVDDQQAAFRFVLDERRVENKWHRVWLDSA
jgi:hypothetical protein